MAAMVARQMRDSAKLKLPSQNLNHIFIHRNQFINVCLSYDRKVLWRVMEHKSREMLTNGREYPNWLQGCVWILSSDDFHSKQFSDCHCFEATWASKATTARPAQRPQHTLTTQLGHIIGRTYCSVLSAWDSSITTMPSKCVGPGLVMAGIAVVGFSIWWF